MMRMMRKMFKRIVSIVMALLVILGTAGYGGSAFAEETQEQADSASATFSNEYIYLDSSGMTLGNVDWTNSNAKVCIRFTDAAGGDPKTGDCKNGIWKFQVSNLNHGNSKFYFTYINGTGDKDWNQIKGNNYYRTAESTLTVDKARGSVVVQNGTTTMDNHNVYTIAVKQSYADSKLSFVDMTGKLTGVKAQFSYDENFSKEELKEVELDDNGTVTVPADNGKNMYWYMKFIDSNGTQLTEPIKIEDALAKGGILYYGTVQTDNESSVKYVWSKDKKNSSAPTIAKLYFDRTEFPTDQKDSIQVKIGNGDYQNVNEDPEDFTILSYDLNGKTLSSDTIIEVRKDKITYRFYPNGNRSFVTIDSEGNAGLSIYRNNPSGTYTVYFDATLSELSYAGDTADNSLPKPNEKVWCFAWNDQGDSFKNIVLERDSEKKGSVYKTDLDAMYDHIVFYSSANGKGDTTLTVQNMRAGFNTTSNYTMNLTIPWNLYNNPCFYADSSDDSIYSNVRRSGYWDEVGTVRNAEGKTKDGNGARTDAEIVDIPKGTLTRESDMLYVNTTLYDYYSDYELNGYNRDKYSRTDLSANKGNLHFIYQPFRQFDQALSSYYKQYSASSPIYWGNFQNYNGSPYSDIEERLKLYGSDDWSKFIYDNNSMWGRNSTKYTNSNTSPAGELKNLGVEDGHNATQGLVSDTLSDNNLMIETTSGTVKAPYFDESFLTGNNSKNTVLGKVYKGVTFPFVKEKKTSKSDHDAKGTVEYWTFDSTKSTKNGNLELQQSEADGYFLNPTKNAVYGQTADAGFPDTNGPGKSGRNYFPFNNTDQSGKAATLNYGFGQKFDLKFRLTSDGTVTTSENEKVPIEFDFSGDDDVWVFIDGKLVLDVGGGHGKVSGKINFKDKKATVSSVKKNDASSGGITQNVVNSFENVKEITDDYFNKEHTLTMFYMERGLWESNMKITFNFPDENEFQVEKNVDTTDVAEDFKECFDNVSAFPFTILNQATHYGEKVATGGQKIDNKPFNNTFKDNTIANVGKNKFEYLETCKDDSGNGTEKSDVVHWKAESSDDGTYKHLRWGIIYPSSGNGSEFNATYPIGTSTTNHYKYLQFSLYDGDVNETPALNNMYVELEDSNGTKIGGFLSAGNTYNSQNLKKGKWNTITIDLDKLSKTTTSFDYSKIVNIKFDYNLSRDMYLDDFTFIPSTEVTQRTGFVTKQNDIPDYGSVESGTLMYPLNAVYTVSSGTSESTSTINLLGADGTFTLANGETATFADQFRRGSYIALSEDVDTEVFEPSCTLYENGQEVKNTVQSKSETVKQFEPVALPTQVGQAIKDGRQEIYVRGTDSDGKEQSNSGYTETGWAKKYGTISSNADRDETNTIVFRSFTDPDSSTIATKLKVKYTNKVKTGTIKIAKEGAYLSDTAENLNGEYQIKVTFTNIAGMALENGDDKDKYTYTYKLKLGDSKEITGIPAGTEYTISEILPDDDSSLNDIAIVQPTYDGNDSKYTATKVKDSSGNWVIHGKIKAGSTAKNTVFTFQNTKKPVINLTVKKKWVDKNGNTFTKIPDSVTVKLQRRVKSATEWEDVKVTDSEGKETTVITLKPDNQNTANSWKYVFKNLDRYPDYTTSLKNPYEYRVVEVVKEGEKYKELETGDYFNDCFKVQSYNNGTNVSVDSSETSTKVDETYTITNVYSPKTNIKITKVDASDENVKLNDVEFKLEKLKLGENGNYVVDGTFSIRQQTTSGTEKISGTEKDTPLGIAEFTDLPDGRYRLTETKAKEGYSLLKDPITIIIDRTGTTSVDNENYTFGTDDDTKNTISLKISNRMKFLLPKTGGYGAMLFILCGMALATLCCLIFFLINLRKEVQYSRHKRQRRNAIGK